jgi:hypothetical protein
MWVVPKYYNHRWEYRASSKRHELVIEIPLNAKELLENPEGTTPSSDSIEGAVHSSILEKRKAGFRKSLLQFMIREYEGRRP